MNSTTEALGLRSLVGMKDKWLNLLNSFGSTYVLRYFGEADILIAAYDATYQSPEAVIKCLREEMDFMGRLPVKLVSGDDGD